MRLMLPDTSLPLLGRQDATLTSQCLILHLFLPVSLTSPAPLSISSFPSPHCFIHTPHKMHTEKTYLLKVTDFSDVQIYKSNCILICFQKLVTYNCVVLLYL